MGIRVLIPICFAVPACAIAQTDPVQRLAELQAKQDALATQQQALLLPIEEAKLAIMQRDLRQWGLPRTEEGELIIEHPGHSLVFSAAHEVPRWTAHIVSMDIASGNLARIDTFLPDPKVPVNTDLFNDYWFSGYDRGHMVPSADMRWSKAALSATYLYSNIGPQRPELNRGAWAELEDWIRRTVTYGGERVFVVTGPVLSEDLPVLSTPKASNQVRIPGQYFKVIMDLDGPEQKGLAFLMTNGVNDHPVISYAVPIDSVEQLTGLDFFPALEDELENALEAQREPKAWYHEGDPFFGEVEPMKAPLPKGMYNTVQAKYHVGSVSTVCGTVVSTRRTAKANALYLNMDRVHPHQDFYVTIWEYNGPNFSYDAETYLVDKKVCVTGKITTYDDIPRISVNNEHEIQLWEEAARQ